MLVRTVLLCLVWSVACGQGSTYKLPPPGASDYSKGTVWVKLKPQYREIFRSPAGRSGLNLNERAIRPFVKEPSSADGRVAPRKQAVDISLYYSVNFDASLPVEVYVKDLKATGYFEIVEPVFSVTPLHTPNDPSLVQQGYLDLIKARESWDITKGDESMIIAIVDTGGDLDHPDLQGKLFINTNDQPDGIDNDGDGFIDNYRGWDFSGADLALIGTEGFVGDNDPSVYKGNLFSHGSMVAGCAAASTNNGIGISAVGYKTKLLFTKHFADNQADENTGYSSDLYSGILYAATHGAKIINCSWGGYYPSTIAQDIITYVTLDMGCLVIAASGNSNLETPLYPASYEYVMSVAASGPDDVRSYFSNYGKSVDIIAPGEGIYTTAYNDTYITESGTSLATPVVSGAAALVWTLHPEYTPLQVAEQLRVSADISVYDSNPAFLNKLGHGRLDVLRALTTYSPALRVSNELLVNYNNAVPEPGQQARLYFDFTNFLQPSSAALKATISTQSPYVTIVKNTVNLGAMAQNETRRNTSTPFEIQLLPSLPVDETVEILITFSDGAYSDSQLFNMVIPSFIDVNENNILTSITAGGRVGFGNTQTQSNGSGFVYNEQNLLYEMGLIMGTSASTIDNNLRSTGGQFDQDFTPSGYMVKRTPGIRAYSEITGSMRNRTELNEATLSVDYRSLVWKNEPYQDFVIVEYKVKNVTNVPINNFYVGLFADWDIVDHGANDRASWHPETKLGYVYAATTGSFPQTGIQLLTGNPQYYAIDNDHELSGNPFGIYDGFTDEEKFTAISSGETKIQAGNPTMGNDVSHVVGSGPYDIAAGQTLTVAFALHASGTRAGLINSARYADSLYNYTLKAPVPVAPSVQVCENGSSSLHATGASKFKWYRDLFGGEPVSEGASLNLPPMTMDTVLYVSNADHTYESARTPVAVDVVANPEIQASGPLTFCEGESVTLSTGDADEFAWSNGAKTASIEITSPGIYTVEVRNDTLTCRSRDEITVNVYHKPSAAFTIFPEIPVAGQPLTFSASDEAPISWQWDFGDGTSGTSRNEEHTYDDLRDYVVTLTVTSSQNCVDTRSLLLGNITAVESGPKGFATYPNPVRSGTFFIDVPEGSGTMEVNLTDIQGRNVIHKVLEHGDQELDISALGNGAYILFIKTDRDIAKRKIIVAR